MDVVAGFAFPCCAIGTERLLQFREQVRIRPEMAQMVIAFGLFLVGHGLFHGYAVVEVKCIALDESRGYAFPVEDVLEGLLDR